MSDPKKQKKPFLKKGTRQFLSNAQVRSQSSKPKIVQYTDDDQQNINTPSHITFKRPPSNQQQNYQIPTRKKSPKTKSVSKAERNVSPAQIRNMRSQVSNLPPPSRKKSPIIKKKEANLQDYLDDEEAIFVANSRSKKKETSKSSYTHIHDNKKNVKNATPVYQKKGSLTGMLQQQQQDQEVDHEFQNNSSFVPIANPNKQKKQQREKSPLFRKSVQKQIQAQPRNLQQKFTQPDEGEEFNFVSDHSEDEVSKSKSKQKQNKRMNRGYSPEPQVSHIKNKYFGKNQPTTHKNQLPAKPNKPLTISDIPKELKQQIINQTIAQQQQQFYQQLQKVKQKVEEANRAKHKFQEANRNFEKQKKQFMKEMEAKESQFQEKMKAELSKLNREKKYMKDHQLSNKGEYKNKGQIADLKKTIQDMKEERKRAEKKLKIELEQVRKKYEEELSKNKLLTDQIRILEVGKIAQIEQIKEHKKIIQQKPVKWYDPPKQVSLQILLLDKFSLNQLPLQAYHYQYNQLYRYYEQIRDQELILQNQQDENVKIKRTYTSGKVQTEYINKFVKERFPFDYTITHHINGDVKQELMNRRIIIYFSQNSEATEIKAKNRVITFFHKNGTVQMEAHQTNGLLEQIYNGERLRRVCPDGKVIEEKIQY